MPTTTTQPAGLRHHPGAAPPEDLPARVDHAVDAATDALLRKQHPDAHLCAELEGDSILITEYLLMKAILGHHEPPEATTEDLRRFDRMLAYLRRLQRADATWGQHPGSPPDLSATVKAYLTLKLFGEDRDAPHMARARQAVLDLGGAERINTFSNFFLACLGQVSWDACPAIPPEIVLLPRWFPFHMTKVSAWTRTMILPLALCTALRPVRHVPSHEGCAELFRDPAQRDVLTPARPDPDPLGWTNLFLGVDRLLKLAQRLRLTPLRGQAIAKAERWILERVDPKTTDGLGAIFPPMVYIQIAFQALGYRREHPVIREAERQLDRFIVEEEDEWGGHIRIQPCFSPVWDTGIALYALTEAGLTAEDERVARTCRWLLDREVTLEGDWHDTLRPEDRKLRMGRDIGAWSFEYRNDWYPDVDDTAMVAKALRRALGESGGAMATTPSPPPPDPATRQTSTDPRHDNPRARGHANATPTSPLARDVLRATQRATRWILAMQNDDGGWAAFDRTTHREWMEHVPFADHNAMQDPSCADITGRTIESLITNGLPQDHPAIRNAVEYLKREQHPTGSWFGRWGVNHIYGTWQATGGLAHAGENPNQPYLRKTLDWLRSIQNPDAGFGESANSYLDDALIGHGPSTPSQTAWAAMAIMFLLPRHEVATDPTLTRAIQYLLDAQLTRDHAPDLTNPFTPGGMATPGAMATTRSPSPCDPASRQPATDHTRANPGCRGYANAPAPPDSPHPRDPTLTGAHGANYLPEPAGSWTEPWFTGTGFPRVFYLRYHLYRHYFPLMALARYRNLTK